MEEKALLMEKKEETEEEKEEEVKEGTKEAEGKLTRQHRQEQTDSTVD